MLFLWTKAFHIIAVICWMAGILYLYRLLIYHTENIEKPDIDSLLTTMEYRLYRYITVPALMVTWVAGLAMVALAPEIAKGGWFPVKFFLVLFLTVSTVQAKKIHLQFKEKKAPYPSSKKLRVLNEVPTVLMIAIVFLVVLKPFS